MTFAAFVVWALEGPGSGVLCFLLMERVKKLRKIMPDWKRFTAWGISGGIAAVIWGLALVLRAIEIPPGPWYEWAKEAFRVITTAILAGEAAHGLIALRQRANRLRKVRAGGTWSP